MGEDGSSGGAMARRLAEPSGGEGGEGGGVMPIERGGGGVRGASRCILSFRGPGALGVVVLHGGEGGGEAGASPDTVLAPRLLLVVVVVVVVVAIVLVVVRQLLPG